MYLVSVKRSQHLPSSVSVTSYVSQHYTSLKILVFQIYSQWTPHTYLIVVIWPFLTWKVDKICVRQLSSNIVIDVAVFWKAFFYPLRQYFYFLRLTLYLTKMTAMVMEKWRRRNSKPLWRRVGSTNKISFNKTKPKPTPLLFWYLNIM